jgi:hypothetical protein
VDESGVVGEIDLQRRDGHMALRRGMEVRAFSIVLGRAGAADPIHHLAVRALLGDHPLGGVAPAEPAELGRAQRS